MPKSSSSSQKLLPRKPRVQIEYDVEVGGATRKVELPWVTGVMSDLSGANSGELPDLAERKFAEVDSENFDTFMKDQKPRMNFAVENLLTGEGRLGVDVTLEKMDDLSPDEFARKVGAEIIEIKLTEEGKGADRRYVLDGENPESVPFGESVTSLDVFNREFVAYKIGEKPSEIEVAVVPNIRNSKESTLRIVKKGPLAKLLDARSRLKELLIKVDGKGQAQKALEEILADRAAVEATLRDSEQSDAPEKE